jgi:penicillin-insensitive murein DD-endopeptidase
MARRIIHARRPAVSCALLFAFLLFASPYAARAQSSSLSIGLTNRGQLEDAARLEATPHLLLQPPGGSRHFGTEELVGLIERAAARVQALAPGPRLLVGSLSSRSGGRLPPHGSHQNGRDADLGFFLTDEDGRPAEPSRFLELDRDGCARERGQVFCLDPRRTFLLVAAMLEDPITRVQWVLMAEDLRQLVLAAGRRSDADDDLIERVTLATEPRQGSASHRSHLHVRIYCPLDDRPRCRDAPPYYPWYEGEPPAQASPARRSRARAAQRRRQRNRDRAARRARRRR